MLLWWCMWLWEVRHHFTVFNCLDLKENSTLNSRAAAEAGVDGEFKLENFTYTTSTILEALSGHLSRTNFSGITVRQRYLHWMNHNRLVVCSRENIQTVMIENCRHYMHHHAIPCLYYSLKIWRFMATVMVAKLCLTRVGGKCPDSQIYQLFESASHQNLVVYSRGNIHTVMIRMSTLHHHHNDITSWMFVFAWRYWATVLIAKL